MSSVTELIDKLNTEKHLENDEWINIFDSFSGADAKYAAEIACKISLERFGNKVFLRGIIEFSNVCKNDCLYCGIKRSNRNISRYRLEKDEILDCCAEGYGYRTFVLQSGKDEYYTTEMISDIVSEIKRRFPDCAVTLSLGEKEKNDYLSLFKAGADRYLLRHETADSVHYQKLHPDKMSFEHRMKCLYDLKETGFQTGAGMMVGSPYQTSAPLAEDMIFLRDFKLQMVGIGPFLPHKDTPFADFTKGSLELTLFCLSLLRIMLLNVLLPAATALGTIDPTGREKGVLAGANVIMPNLSPVSVRDKYILYDNKICTGDRSSECRGCIERRFKGIGYEIEISRGDYRE